MTTNTAAPRDTTDSAAPAPTPATATTPTSTNVNVGAGSGSPGSGSPRSRSASIWTVTRVTALVFTVLEVLLVVRFALKLFGANAEQPLAAALYGVTDPLVAPFRGIFAQPAGTPVIEIGTLLAIVFFMLVAALTVALARAFTGKRGEGDV